MNAQEIFDKVYLGLDAQNCRSMKKRENNNFVCAYRGENGTKCAVGMLIDDDTAAVWENYGGIVDVPVGFLPPWAIDNMELLKEIQHAHDNNTDLEDMFYELERVAEVNGLSVPTI